MKTFIVFLAFLAVATCANDFCYKDTERACNPASNKLLSGTPNCNAKYGAIDALQPNLQEYANELLYRSFDFLLMSTYYANYVKNRPGFEALYRKYSDSLWDDGVELIKYIDSRGGSMNFRNIPKNLLGVETLETEGAESKPKPKPKPDWELSEYQSLAKALDLEKELAEDVFNIHLKAAGQKKSQYDPELAYHLEKEFVEKHREHIRQLAGYTHDLGDLLKTPDASLAVYLFDEMLQKGKY